jgi:hypothetical protein
MPANTVSRAAFTWIGPVPRIDEPWSHFQVRWAAYSCGWFLQFGLVFSVLYAIAARWPGTGEEAWFRMLAFAVSLGAGMAVLAALGFLFKAAKARFIGPDPQYVEQLEEDAGAQQ